MGVFKRTKDAFSRSLNGDDVYEIAGAPLVCPHCECTHFNRDQVLLNTRGMSFLGLDWANGGADVYICKNCGHIDWFAQQ